MSRADTVTMHGSQFALADCRIVALRGGQIVYEGPAGRRQQPLDEIASLGFDDLGDLDDAEEAFSGRDYDGAIRGFLRALLGAKNDVQRKWIHARLADAHDARGEYVLAAGHAGAVFAMEDHPSWKRLEPLSELDRPSYPAAKEAFDHLRAAQKTVRSSELVRIVAKLLRVVQDVQAETARDYDGPALRRGATISGLTPEEILAPESSEEAPETPDQNARTLNPMPAEPEPVEATPQPTPVSIAAIPAEKPMPAAVSPKDIETLLAAGQFGEAAARCRRQLADASGGGRASVLYAYGRALNGLDRPEDAAVMFTRCAVLHPDTVAAAHSLRATARIYETLYHRPDTAARLLSLAASAARRAGQPTLADEILAEARREGR